MKKEQIGFESFKEKVTIERLRQNAEKVNISSSSSDYIAYPEFLKYFADLKTITKHNVIIGINFSYGWMPTMFDFRSNNFNEIVDILNRAKQGQIPTETELEVLKKCFNNSLVGTSKLLHFINPNMFAIWDSRVLRYLTNRGSNSYRLDKSKLYLDFLKFCKYITNQPGYNEIHNLVVEKLNQGKMTKYRTVELIMYETERNSR
jgi:hypothetical protein